MSLNFLTIDPLLVRAIPFRNTGEEANTLHGNDPTGRLAQSYMQTTILLCRKYGQTDRQDAYLTEDLTLAYLQRWILVQNLGLSAETC